MATCGYNQTVNYVQVSYEGSINKNVSCKSIWITAAIQIATGGCFTMGLPAVNK